MQEKPLKGFVTGHKAFENDCFSKFKVNMKAALISAERKAGIRLSSGWEQLHLVNRHLNTQRCLDVFKTY